MSAGDVLKEARRRHGATQQQLAIRARTSQAAISRIERGVVSPSVDTLGRLLDLLGEQPNLSARPVDHGFDLSLIRANLKLTPEERVRKQARFANGLREFRRKIGVEPGAV
jgi:transcriptional regulator with XRE-family HTH domain